MTGARPLGTVAYEAVFAAVDELACGADANVSDVDAGWVVMESGEDWSPTGRGKAGRQIDVKGPWHRVSLLRQAALVVVLIIRFGLRSTQQLRQTLTITTMFACNICDCSSCLQTGLSEFVSSSEDRRRCRGGPQ